MDEKIYFGKSGLEEVSIRLWRHLVLIALVLKLKQSKNF